MRGSPHAHAMFWIRDAPEYIEGNISSECAVIKFMDEFITCERSTDPDLQAELKYQIHSHSSTCYKKCKYGKICRFGFPKPPLPATLILTPLPKTFAKRSRKEAQELCKRIQEDLKSRGRNPAPDKVMDFDQYLLEMNVSYDEYVLGKNIFCF